MKYIFSVSMVCATLVFSLIYYITVEKTGVAASHYEVVLTAMSESDYVKIQSVGSDSLVFMPTPKNSPIVYHCLISGDFFEKMTGYGMELKDFLNLTSVETHGDGVVIQTTHRITVMNYFTSPSEPFAKGKVYYLIAGERNAEGEFTNHHTNCIKIQP